MKKGMNNKGFSLVELIVVIAIMAVLIGVLAPQFLRYVEKSRLQKDNQSISEIANAAKAAMANETVYNEVGAGKTITPSGKTYTFSAAGAGTINFDGELANTVGTQVVLTSKKYSTAPSLAVTVNTTTSTVEVKSVGGYFDDVSETTGKTKTF
jgi:type IV pilus assembly protein PilA